MYSELVEILNKGKKLILLLHIHHRKNANVNYQILDIVQGRTDHLNFPFTINIYTAYSTSRSQNVGVVLNIFFLGVYVFQPWCWLC
jgi:hypothetical protein